MKKITEHLLLGLLLLHIGCSKSNDAQGTTPEKNQDPVQFVFTSDAHYGLKRAKFHGATNVDAHVVNADLVRQMNTLPSLTLPNDDGVNSGKKVDYVDYVLEGGDIANRMEVSAKVQLGSISWQQFEQDYIKGITLKNKKGENAPLYLVPGNHDVSNTIGYYATMDPLTDPTSLVNIYNRMVAPAQLKTTTNFDYSKDRVNYSKEIGGVHFCFIQMWPDSSVRIWMEKDLANVSATTPVAIVAHDQPGVVSNHFKNPNGKHDINNVDLFDNVLDEEFKDGTTAKVDATIEQRAFASFLKKHPNIKLYLHGHVHKSQFETWTGPDNDVSLISIGADSPMKGLESAADETKLSFAFCTLDPKTMKITIRECMWDKTPDATENPIQWGESHSYSLK